MIQQEECTLACASRRHGNDAVSNNLKFSLMQMNSVTNFRPVSTIGEGPIQILETWDFRFNEVISRVDLASSGVAIAI